MISLKLAGKYKFRILIISVLLFSLFRRHYFLNLFLSRETINNNELQTTELIEAAKTAQDNDHEYTKPDEEFETVFIKPDDQQIYIMQSVDENGVLNNIEVLLAAAETTEEVSEDLKEATENEDENVKNSDEPQKIYFVQGENSEVLCLEGEFILP